MKKILFLFAAFFTFSAANAQYYIIPNLNAHKNPGTYNTDIENVLSSSSPPGWNVLHAGPAATPVWTAPVNFPGTFNFRFNNVLVNSFKVSTSGVLTFDTAAVNVPSSTNTALPSADIPDRSICVWGLSSGGFTNKIAYKMFGAAPNRQFWVQFNHYSSPDVIANGGKYWSIVLEENTQRIYVVDQRAANGPVGLTVGLQIDAATAIQVPASPNVAMVSTNLLTPEDNAYYEFIYGVQPNYDLQILNVNMPAQVPLSKAPYQIKGRIKNMGALAVTSFELKYQIDANPWVMNQITGVNIPPQGIYDFVHPVTWNPGGLGNFSIQTETGLVNGNPDQDPLNNSDFKLVDVLNAPRTVLHEVFTSSTCPPCLPGNANLREITKENPGISIDIKYQQNYPAPGNDPYQSSESIGRHNYYGINSIPRMEVDGGWNGNANSYTPSLLAIFQQQPSDVLVEGTYTVTGNTVMAAATIKPFANITSNNLAVHMVITEKYSVNNARTNGETKFYDVMKKMMPNQLGTSIGPLTANSAPVSLSQTFTFPTPNMVEHFDSLRVVIFLQDRVTKKVYNAAFAEKTGGSVGISENTGAFHFTIYPNPANSELNVNFTPEKAAEGVLRVFNLTGAEVLKQNFKTRNAGAHQLKIDLKNQVPGIYLVSLQIEGKTVTKKISVIK